MRPSVKILSSVPIQCPNQMAQSNVAIACSLFRQTWSVLQYLQRSSEAVTTELLNATTLVYINGGMSQFAVDMLLQYAQFKVSFFDLQSPDLLISAGIGQV